MLSSHVSHVRKIAKKGGIFISDVDITARDTNTNDIDIINDIFAGNINAFEVLVKKYEKMIYNLAMTKLRNRETAEDITQECFLRAYKMLRSYRTDSAFSTWIYRICQNLIIDYYRKNKNFKTYSLTTNDDDGEEKVQDIADSSEEPLEAIVRQEKVEKVRELINSLPDDLREVIILRDIKDYSYKEIADMLDLEIGTVKSRLSRSREKLKTLIKENMDVSELL